MAHFRSSMDLNLIPVLDALFRHQSVSNAAKELGLTQSALSHSLAKLRDQYKDPLFVRVSRGIVPTEFAASIRSEVEDIIANTSRLAERVQKFEPAKAEGKIVISCTDFFEAVAGSKLFARIHREAPAVQLAFRPASGPFPKDLLENGSCDLAIGGYFSQLPNGFFKQKLFTDSYSTTYRKGHPCERKKLSERDYFVYDHARMSLQGDFNDQLAKVLDGKKHSRIIKYTSGNFSSLLLAVSEADLLLTAPSSLINIYKKILPLHTQECPIPVKPIEVQMVWHGLTNQSPLRKWVRQVVKEVCTSIENISSKSK